MDQCEGGERSGLVGVGIVGVGIIDADVEGLIRYLPEEGARCLRLVSRSDDSSRRNWHTWRPGVSMPAVTMRFDVTNQDIPKGRKTGRPVSSIISLADASRRLRSAGDLAEDLV